MAWRAMGIGRDVASSRSSVAQPLSCQLHYLFMRQLNGVVGHDTVCQHRKFHETRDFGSLSSDILSCEASMVELRNLYF